MKLTVANLSSNTLSVPSPLNVTLTSGKSVVVVLKDTDWKAAQTSEPIQRLLRAKMLALAPLDEAPAALVEAPKPAKVAHKAPEPAPVVAPEPPAPVVEAPVEAPVAEPEAPVEAPVAEPEAPVAEAEAPVDTEAPVEAEDSKKKSSSKKSKAKEGKGW